MSEPLPRLAVLIDADNTSPKVAEGLFLEIAKLGEASVRRIYGDFSDDRLKGWAKILANYAIIPHQQFAYTQGKNSSDIALVIDAMDLLHSGRFDGFCLVSSDSDFTRLASRIREQGMHAYGFGQRKTPEAFRQACLRFFYIENLMAEAEAAAAHAAEDAAEEPGDAPAQSAGGEGAAEVAGEGTAAEEAAKPRRPEAPSRAVPLIRKAMEGMTDEDGWVSLGVIGQRIGALAPDFDSRTYGSSKLSDLIRRAGPFDMKKDDANHVRVRFKANGTKTKTRKKKDEAAEG
ncbi:NYN domain-containing protein [Albimonas sp. CAU 1670]|uniref:NYN domain-containing protein n=1 Tax=Albimonas sp. CAU 1670 TaxID=3032599 RepID=UPI0023DA8D82|nr:NYN domain-containing protein [Albimonas sp. CAU 1670]MDF2233988.1 NYN domain-containing protein [Albimonas sp. CAU 1670]